MPDSVVSQQIHLDSEQETLRCGAGLAAAVRETKEAALVIYLVGDLGAGKTTFVRGFLRGLGHAGRVPSPTYTLIEPYELAGYAVAHIDLYRLQSVGEATALALDELSADGPALVLIEWPEKGRGEIPAADLEIELEIAAGGRNLRMTGRSAAGRALVAEKS